MAVSLLSPPSSAPAAPTSAARIRRLPVPITEPPYDDELSPADRGRASSPVPLSQGTLALAFVLPSGLPAVPRPSLRLVPDLDDDAPAPVLSPSSSLPDARRWAGQLVQAMLEVITGDRPVAQLVRWTTPSVYAEVRLATREYWFGSVASAATRRGPGAETSSASRASVRSVHVSEPTDGAAEVCATVLRGTRAAAVALRLEGRDGRWQCVALELG